MLNTGHSAIPEYPPNVLKYPKFYNSLEKIIILEPGDMLYIPPMWFHWIHSYPDENLENFAVSFNIIKVKEVFNRFEAEIPFVFHLDKNTEDFLNINPVVFQDNTFKHKIILSENRTIVPVKKSSLDIYPNKIELSMKEIFLLKKKKKYNISIGQNSSLNYNLNIKTPKVLENSFPGSKFIQYLWMYYIKDNDSYIDTGLHVDRVYNVLCQVKGKKVIRLYHPGTSDNMYIQPMEFI